MDFELRAAREKLEREQRERKARAKALLERDRKAKAEAARQREALEAAQRMKRIEAAQAQIKVQQEMEESLIIGKGILFSRMLEATPHDGFGDKIKLPPSCFKDLSDQGALDKGPMYFRLSRIDASPSVSDGIISGEHETTHSGVLEFTAAEGSVELPPHVWSNLFRTDNWHLPLVEVRYVSLPKGTYAKLKPEGMGFFDIPNHKAVLETTLRKHATLSEGDILRVCFGELNYNLRVLELKPSSSISVLDTDIEVDIEGSDVDMNGEKFQHVLIPLIIGKPETGIVEEGTFKYYKFSVEDAISHKLVSGEMNLEVKLESDGSDGDNNVYVSRHPLVFPTQHRHQWSSHDMGSKILIINHKDHSMVGGTYSIGVFGFKGTSKYQISVVLRENRSKQTVGTHAGPEVDVDTVECRNCRRYISSGTIQLHEAYCARHNVVCQHVGCGIVLRKEESSNHVHCDKCGRAFQKEELEKHMLVFHVPIHCPCGITLEKDEMVEHQSLSCPLRLIACRFCGDMVQAGAVPVDARDRLRGLTEHESVCGSRTTPCTSCGRAVMLKDMDIHITAVHQKS